MLANTSRVKFEALIVAQTILQDNNIKNINIFSKFKNYIIYLCVYMLMGHRLHVEVKGQFEGVGSLLHHMRPGDGIQDIRLSNKCLELTGLIHF